jgi:hypothetical protein
MSTIFPTKWEDVMAEWLYVLFQFSYSGFALSAPIKA